MLFKDHEAYDPDGPLWKSIGGPVCPMCFKDLHPEDDVVEFEGYIATCLGHTACVPLNNHKDLTVPWLTDAQDWHVPAEMNGTTAKFGTWGSQTYSVSEALNHRHDKAPTPNDRIEVPIYTIDPKTGEKIESGSVTISKADFHKDNPEFKPSPVADNLKDLFNDSTVQGDEGAQESPEEGS